MQESKRAVRSRSQAPARRNGLGSAAGLSSADVIALVQEAGSRALECLPACGGVRRGAGRGADEHPACFSERFYRAIVQLILRHAMRASARSRRRGGVGAGACRRGLEYVCAGSDRAAERAACELLSLSAASAAEPAAHLAAVYQLLLELTPVVDIATRELVLQPARRQLRWRSGSYFTPPTVVDGLLDVALEPLLEDARKPEDVLDLRICDPACGAGAFLIPAAKRLAGHVARLAPAGTRGDVRRALIERVFGSCIVGVDRDPAAAELCRFALWQCWPDKSPELPWLFLENRIRIGNSLLGITPRMTERARHQSSKQGAADDERCMELPAETETNEPRVDWHTAFADVFSPGRCAEPHPGAGWHGGFDLVIGNPPFLNQLETASAAPAHIAAFLKARFDGAVRCYADTATAFLALGAQLLRPEGRLTMIQPQSVLAARDAGRVRSQLAQSHVLEAVWMPTERIFDASVRVCAPLLRRTGARDGRVQLLGDGFALCDVMACDMDAVAKQETWSPLVAPLLGVPRVQIRSAAQLAGDRASITADFRDQFYGLRGAVAEEEDGCASSCPRLVTTGVIDLAYCAWGERTLRFDGRRWERPRVDVSRLDDALQRWAQQRLQPKVIIATQTRIIEAIVDPEGVLLPTTPLISLTPHDVDDLWPIAAALCSPPIVALAMERHAGAALAGSALKLSARQIAALPLPRASSAWDEAAEAFRRASAINSAELRIEHLRRCAALMCSAYGVRGAAAKMLLDWWHKRLMPGRHGSGRRAAARGPVMCATAAEA